MLRPSDEPDRNEALTEAVTMAAQIESIVGHAQLAPADVCQAAGGGTSLPGCGAPDSVGAAVSLAPEETGLGCGLLSAGGGIRLHCGGIEAEPAAPSGIDLPLPAIDSTTTLKDLLEIWLLPVDPASMPLAMAGGDASQIADAATTAGVPRWN